jgi:hypothetical protein
MPSVLELRVEMTGFDQTFRQKVRVGFTHISPTTQDRQLAFTARVNQIGSDQFLQVMRNGGLSDREFGDQSFAGNLVLSSNAGENREALWISKSFRNSLYLVIGQIGLNVGHRHQSRLSQGKLPVTGP